MRSLAVLPVYPYSSVMQHTFPFCTQVTMSFFVPPAGNEAEQSLFPAAAKKKDCNFK